MRLLFVIGFVITIYVTNLHAVPEAADIKIRLSKQDKEQSQQLIQDIARNFSALHFESATWSVTEDRIVSPLSYFIPLSLLSYGARGQTREIFLKALGLPKNQTHLAKFGYEKFLDKLAKYDVRVKTKVFVPSGVTLKSKFSNLSTNVFNSEIDYVNVTDGFMDSRKINEWVAAQTNDNVTDLFEPQQIGRNPSIVLVNTVYFKGIWKKAFYKSQTALRPFHPVNGEAFDVLTMYTAGRFRHGRVAELYFDFLELPFKSNSEDEGMSMIILLPDKEEYLEWVALVHHIRGMKLDRLLNGKKEEVEVYLPKFKIESKFSLTGYLNQFFAPVVAKQNQTKVYPTTANFSGIFETSGLSNIGGESLMKVVFEVDEEGQETAESSGIFYNTTGSVSSDRKPRSASEPVQFKVDRPFLALVVTKGKILTDVFSINFPGIQFIPKELLPKD